MNKKNKKRTAILLTVVTACILSAAAFALYNASNKQSDKSGETPVSNPASAEDPTPETDVSPPSEEERAEADTVKETIAQAEEAPKRATANMTIVDAMQYDNEIEVRAFVAGALANGTCTIIFEKNNIKFSEKTNAFADASTTPCLAVTVDRSSFSEPGIWTVTVTYVNEGDTLTASATQNIEIQ